MHTINGQIAAIPAGGGTPWLFAGPTATITVTAGQRVTGSVSAVFSHSNNSVPQVANFSLCYSETAAGSPLDLLANPLQATIAVFPNKTALPASASLVFANAGTYRFGFCVRNVSGVNFGANDFASGWLMVTN